MAKNAFDRAAARGIAFVKAHPELSFEFNLLSAPGHFPPMVQPANNAARQLDTAIEGNEGFSGAGYFASFSLFMGLAQDEGFRIEETPKRTLVIRAPGK